MSEKHVRYKGCDCSGTSSGPRVVTIQQDDDHGIRFMATLKAFACDVCDAPWSEWLAEPGAERGEA